MPNSTKSRRKRKARKLAKPKKPYESFPLTPHSNTKYCKQVHGKLHYFGNWAKRENGKLVRAENDGWREALDAYERQAKDLHSKRKPRVDPNELELSDLIDGFLSSKRIYLDSGELSIRTFKNYYQTCEKVLKFFGKRRLVLDLRPEEFGQLRAELGKSCGLVRLKGEITTARMIFKFAYDNGLIENTIRYEQAVQKRRNQIYKSWLDAGFRHKEQVLREQKAKRIQGKSSHQVRVLRSQNGDVSEAGHPGFGEGVVPIWGAARSAAAYYEEGRWFWGTVNAALAVTDVIPIRSALSATGKAILKIGGKKVTKEGAETFVRESGEKIVQNVDSSQQLLKGVDDVPVEASSKGLASTIGGEPI